MTVRLGRGLRKDHEDEAVRVAFVKDREGLEGWNSCSDVAARKGLSVLAMYRRSEGDREG